MNISVKSSLCAPKKCPLNLQIDPTQLTVTAVGTPEMRMSPFELELPRIRIEGKQPIEVDLPDPEFETSLYTIIPYVETPIGGDRKVPAARTTSGGDATRLNGFGVGIGFEMRANLGKMEVDLGEIEIDLGKIRMHGVPVKGNDQPFTVGMDLDKLTFTAGLSKIDARFSGCVVLNGAEGCCDDEKRPTRK